MKKILISLSIPFAFLKALLWDIPMIELKYMREKNERLQKRD
jgi:hypothetical protein